MEANTKQQLIDFFVVRFPNNEPQLVEVAIGRALNTLMYAAFRKDLSNLDLYAKTFADVAVQKDETDTYYSLLPVQTVQLPDAAEGVRRIYKKKGIRKLEFIPVTKDSWGANLLVNKVSSLIRYSVKPDRVEYKSNPNCSIVYMDLVIPFELMDEDDPVYIPSGQDETLIQMVAQFINGTPMPDKTNK